MLTVSVALSVEVEQVDQGVFRQLQTESEQPGQTLDEVRIYHELNSPENGLEDVVEVVLRECP